MSCASPAQIYQHMHCKYLYIHAMIRSFIVAFWLLLSASAPCQQYFLFVGTYTTSRSEGIYVYSFDAATGKADKLSNTEGVVNPSYLALSAGGEFLYACTETATVNAGGISAFHFDRSTGKLTFINKQSSGGDNPVYVSIHKSGR